MDAHDDATTRHAPPACTCCCHDGQVPDIGEGCDCESCPAPQATPLGLSLRLAMAEGVFWWLGEVAGRG